MHSRYSIFTPYRGSHASQYDAVQLLLLIQALDPASRITFDDLDAALIRTGLSPRSLYEQATAGRYTRDMARLDKELGLPVKEVTSLGGYWQDRLVEVAKQYGKPLETVHADLEQAVEEGNDAGFFISKEDLARSIVLLNDAPPCISIEELDEIKANIQRIADETTEQPAKKTSKTPYYHKHRAKWWK